MIRLGVFGFWGLLVSAVLSAQVRPGIDGLRDVGFRPLSGKRVGLVTNPSGRAADGTATVDIFYQDPRVNLVALFGPEHGVYGDVPAGEYVASSVDRRTGLPVYSLYGRTRKLTPEMLKDVDVMVVDLQDIGCRSYTYISTLGLVMEAVMELGKEVMVLDRPNPLGGLRVEGPMLDPRVRSFVGLFNIPYVYGLTLGELAFWIRRHELNDQVKLTVVRMRGWKRGMVWEDTGLIWKATSPNIPGEAAVRGYVATGFLGEIGIANGANDRWPFELAAAENWDGEDLARRLSALGLAGITVEPHRFRPLRGAFTQVDFEGVRVRIDPRAQANLTAFSFYVLDAVRANRPGWNPFSRAPKSKIDLFDKVLGGSTWREQWERGKSASDLEAQWVEGVNAWRKSYRRYWLYEE